MSECICPICNREYESNPKSCICGFSELVFPQYLTNKPFGEFYENTMFCIYKFAKKVIHGDVAYEKSKVTYQENGNEILITDTHDSRGLALIDFIGEAGVETVAADGLLAFGNAFSLILNTDRASSNFLDESRVVSLFLGADFKGFEHGFFLAPSQLRYLSVSGKNPYFCSDNNVMFDKDMSRLVCYAPGRPEEEYRVPESVKVLGSYSFYFTRNLKRLYLPRGINREMRAFYFAKGEEPEIIYY